MHSQSSGDTTLVWRLLRRCTLENIMPRPHHVSSTRTGLCLVIGVSLLLASSSAFAQFDTVKRSTGKTKNGKLNSMTKDQIVLTVNALDEEIPVSEILSVSFDGEPTDLKTARLNLSNGRYGEAKKILSKIVIDNLQREVVQNEVRFYLALCDAKLALTRGDSVDAAFKNMLSFINANSKNYHFYEACQALGDLSVRKGDYARAGKYYRAIGKAPWTEYKMKAAVLAGRASQAGGGHAAAMKMFDFVLGKKATSPKEESWRLAATLGKAVAIAASKDPEKANKAIGVVKQVIEKAAPEEAELHARAYNALGKCYLQTGATKDALIAFLHVDVLYSAYPQQHAESLFQLAKLWDEVGKSDRARQASALLKKRYPNSPWTRQ